MLRTISLYCTLTLILSTLYSSAQCTFTASVPYFESFSALTANNQLPNCWTSNNIGSSTLTYTNSTNAYSGASCVSFYHSPAGGRYFYSNGIQLYAGIVYSVNVFYKTDNTGGTNWSNLQLGLSTVQAANGTTVINTIATPNTPVYTAISGTIAVTTSSIYYLSLTGSVFPGAAEQLYFDNFSINIPCSGPGAINAPTVSISTNNGYTTTPGATSICANSQSTLTAIGANSYSWNGGITTATRVLGSGSPGAIFVIGTNTLTGCTSSATISQIHPIPTSSINATASVICPGESTTLTVAGANTYTWFNSSNATTVAITPTTTTAYSVVGTFTNTGCKNVTTFTISVKSPTVMVTASPPLLCRGSSAILSASGTSNYSWTGGTLNSNSSSVTVSPSVTTVYTVIGSNSAFCKDTALLQINILPSPSIHVQGSTTICKGETHTLVASGATSLQFQGTIVSQNNGTATLSPLVTSNYTIIGTDPNGCSDTVITTITVDKCIGINEVATTQRMIFPNPFSNELYILLDRPAAWQLYSISGQKWLQGNALNEVVSTPHLPSGYYLLEIFRDGFIYRYQLVKD